jgi:hypothetical protein
MLLLATLALPLAACGGPAVNEENASVEEVSEKVREASREQGLIRPGKWVSSVSIEDMQAPGMPPQAAEQMKRMVAQTHSSESCLTAEDVRQPSADFFGGNENCRYDHFTMRGGKIDAQMRCDAAGASQLMRMEGTYSPDSYEMRMTTRSDGTGGAPLTMQMKVEAERVGECDPAEA